MDIDRLIDCYHTLTPETVSRLSEFYSADAYFKDPFNEVRGIDAIKHIFTHMFRQVEAPRFVITDQVVDADGAMLVWNFFFQIRTWGHGKTRLIRGVSHLRFDADGKINYHRDYWDAAEELYMTLPIIGTFMRWIQRRFSTPIRDKP